MHKNESLNIYLCWQIKVEAIYVCLPHQQVILTEMNEVKKDVGD